MTPFWLLSVVGWFGFRRVKSGSDRDLMWAIAVVTIVCLAFYWCRPLIDRTMVASVPDCDGILDDTALAVPCPSWRRDDASLSMDEGFDTCCVSDQLSFCVLSVVQPLGPSMDFSMVVLLSVDRLHVGDCPPKFAIISLRIDVPMYSRRFPGFVNVWSFLQYSCKCLFHDCRIDWSAVAETDFKVERQLWERFLQSFITVIGNGSR